MLKDKYDTLGKVDSADDIRRCLNCKKKECDNCLEYSTQPMNGRGPKHPIETVRKVVELVNAGYTHAVVADMCNVSRNTVYKWVKRYAIPDEDQ